MVIADYSRDWKTHAAHLHAPRREEDARSRLSRRAGEGLRRGARHAASASSGGASRGRAAAARELATLNAQAEGPRPADLRRGPATTSSRRPRSTPTATSTRTPSPTARSRRRRRRDLDALEQELDQTHARLATLKKEEAETQRGDRAHRGERERDRERAREAVARTTSSRGRSSRAEAGHALPTAQLADPRHDQSVAAGPAGAAPGPLQRRQLHEDPPRRPLRDLPRRRRSQGIRRREVERGLPYAPPPEPHGRQRVAAPGEHVRVHALPRRPRPRHVVLVRGPLAETERRRRRGRRSTTGSSTGSTRRRSCR